MSNRYSQAIFTVSLLQGPAYTWLITQQYTLSGNNPARLDWQKLKHVLKKSFRPKYYPFKACQCLDIYQQTGLITGQIGSFLLKLNCFKNVSSEQAKFWFILGFKPELASWVHLLSSKMLKKSVDMAEQMGIKYQWSTNSAPRWKKKKKLVLVFQLYQAQV